MEKRIDKGQPIDRRGTGSCDATFAQLADMFGDTVPVDVISRIGGQHKWHLNNCIEQLIKFDPETFHFANQSTNAGGSTPSRRFHNEHRTGTVKKPIAAETLSFAHKVKHQLRNAGTVSPSHKQPRILSKNSGPVPEHPKLKEIVGDINRNLRVMVCMRGAPGSGKSFLARTIVDRTMDGDYTNHIFSTDDFFYDNRTKQYNYNRQQLSQAHDSNQFRVAQRALNGWSPIIIDNTNMRLWEMFAYVKEGIKHGYIVHILEPNTPWCKSVSKMAMKNKHNVDKETIARMLDNYEPGTVADVLRAMNLKANLNPQLRHFPEIRPEPEPALFKLFEVPQNNATGNILNSPPKEQRMPKLRAANASVPAPTEEPEAKLVHWDETEWPAYEDEQQQFWNSDIVTKPANLLNAVPKPPRGESSKNNIFDLLREASQEGKSSDESAAESLTKHEKDCANENKSFQQIRHIYPLVPVSLLWDLFEKCDGDGDWAMDILLNEDFTNGIRKLASDEEIGRDNFTCNCRTPQSELQEAANAIPAQLLQEMEKTSVAPAASRLPRRFERIINDSDSNVRKQIEEQFIIGDEHYSERMRKVRNFRRGIAATPADPLSVDTTLAAPAAVEVTVEDMSPIDDFIGGSGGIGDGADEMIEIDLGIKLVCQLDSAFGTNAIQGDTLKNIKTNVFMPRSLGQQLYAIWMESLYHQIEEQRKETLKDDEQLAKELQEKQMYPQLFQEASTAKINNNNNSNNLRDIVDMQYSWSALKADESEWKQTTPEDLATKLTKAKLFEIFPNIKKETLIEVFAAHDNKFATTVETLKDSLGSEIGEQLHVESQKLVNQAQEEVQAIKSVPQHQAPAHVPNKYDKNLNKMDIEEAKRAALHDFEENRNMAMHHSHLKAECYLKAREAFQRRQPSVALYYSNVANLHNSKIDMYNNKAANAIVEVHSYSQQNQDMLDLHYLHAVEAVECLDIFLDKHIKQLKDMGKGFKYVFIITGRGLHSANGISTIKQRVKGRFRERNLSWVEVNPGLLKVKLQFISPFAHDLNRN